MEIQNIFKGLFFFGVVFRQQDLHFIGNFFRKGCIHATDFIRKFLIIPNGKPIFSGIAGAILQNQVKFFDKFLRQGCPRAKILVKLREVIQELCCGAFPPLGIRPRQRQSALHQQYIIRKSPEDVSWQDLRDYIKWLQKERNLSERTVNATISQLRFFTIYVLHKPWDDNQLPKRKFDEYLPFRFSLSYTRINSSGLLILHHIMLPDQHSDVVKHTGKNQ